MIYVHLVEHVRLELQLLGALLVIFTQHEALCLVIDAKFFVPHMHTCIYRLLLTSTSC